MSVFSDRSQVGRAREVAELLEVDDQPRHRLLGDARFPGELRQSYALVGDVRHHVVVHDAVVLEPGGDEVCLERLRQVTLGEGDEQEHRRVFVRIKHRQGVVRSLDEVGDTTQ